MHFPGSELTRASTVLSVENTDQDTTKSRTSGKLSIFQLFWKLSELRYLQQLFVKTVRHLLHLLSTSASKIRAHVLELLSKYYSLLFASAPAKVHETMVDFNRWLLEVLADTRPEGIEWGPSYGENPWLALEEREPQPEDPEIEKAFTLDAANTIQLLRASREHYMMCCDSLRQTNKDLTAQLEHLKMQLKGALMLAFESQRSLQREKELAALREQRPVLKVRFADYIDIAQQVPRRGYPSQQIANAFRTLDGLSSLSTEAAPTDEANDVDEDASEADVGIDGGSEPEHIDMAASTAANQEEPAAKPVSDDEHESSEQQATQLLKPLGSISSSCDYQQLVQLNTSEKENGSWHHQALGKLKAERDQRRLLRKPSKKTTEAPVATSSMMRKVEAEAASLKLLKPLEFKELAATRDPAHDASGSTWYRKALQLLKAERKHRVSLRDRAESFSSTISIVD